MCIICLHYLTQIILLVFVISICPYHYKSLYTSSLLKRESLSKLQPSFINIWILVYHNIFMNIQIIAHALLTPDVLLPQRNTYMFPSLTLMFTTIRLILIDAWLRLFNSLPLADLPQHCHLSGLRLTHFMKAILLSTFSSG